MEDASVLLLWNRARSKRIRSISLFLVSENCVAITTKQRLIMKKEPIWKFSWMDLGGLGTKLEVLPQWVVRNRSSPKSCGHLARSTWCRSSPPAISPGRWQPRQARCCQTIWCLERDLGRLRCSSCSIGSNWHNRPDLYAAWIPRRWDCKPGSRSWIGANPRTSAAQNGPFYYKCTPVPVLSYSNAKRPCKHLHHVKLATKKKKFLCVCVCVYVQV